MQRFVRDSEQEIWSDKGLLRKVFVRQIRSIKRAAMKQPLLSSKQIFEAAGGPGVPRTSRCTILQSLAVVRTADVFPSLTSAHKETFSVHEKIQQD